MEEVFEGGRKKKGKEAMSNLGRPRAREGIKI